MITLDVVYKLIREAVMAHPKREWRCKAPQSYAILQHISDLDTPNIRKTLHDLREGYVYSAAWAARGYTPNDVIFDYPIVGVSHYNGTVVDVFKKNMKVCPNITIGVYDVLQEPCVGEDCNECSQRNFHQIETDTEAILWNIVSYLGHIVKAEINGAEAQYYSKYYIEYMESQGAVINCLVAKVPMFQIDESDGYFIRADTGIDKILGTELKIKVCMPICTEEDFNFSQVDCSKQITSCCG